MPRIYAPNESYTNNWAPGMAKDGVIVLPAGADASWFDEHGFDVDNSKHHRTVLDKLNGAELRQVAYALKLTIDQGQDPDSKQSLVRAIETEVSSKYITALTITSAAGTEIGDTEVTVTSAGDYTYKFKTAKTTAAALLYLDEPDETWAEFTSAGDVTPGAATDDKITVVRLDVNGLVIGQGNATITKRVS